LFHVQLFVLTFHFCSFSCIIEELVEKKCNGMKNWLDVVTCFFLKCMCVVALTNQQLRLLSMPQIEQLNFCMLKIQKVARMGQSMHRMPMQDGSTQQLVVQRSSAL